MGCGWVVGSKSHSSSSSFFFILSPSQNEPTATGQLPKPLPDNNMGKKKPQLERRGEKEEEESHHCGNVVNCAFLRPWESHTRAGTCGHGKRGLPPQREDLSDAEQHCLITWCGGTGSDALFELCISGVDLQEQNF